MALWSFVPQPPPRRSPASHAIALLAVALAFRPSLAHAQSAADKAAAEALFADGRRLMARSDTKAACEKFEASQKLDPALGTMLNLADCYEKSGRTASAWGIFREASSIAHAEGSRDRETYARSRATAIEPRLSTLSVQAAVGVQIRRNGKPVDPAVFGTPIPVDPGRHVIEASAAGKRTWTEIVEVDQERTRVQVQVPELAPLPGQASASSSSASPSEPGSGPGKTTPTPTPAGPANGTASSGAAASSTLRLESSHRGDVQRYLGAGVGALGLVGAGLSAYFGARASSLWSDARSHCAPYPQNCDSDAARLSRESSDAGNFATVAGIIGAAGLVGGAVLWFTAPRGENAPQSSGSDAHEPAWTIGVGSGRVLVRGAF